MKLLADEGVDFQIVEKLRRDGHSVAYVAEMEPGITDDEVLLLAERGSLSLLTPDKDFGEIIYRQGRADSGVVLIRLSGLTPERKAAVVSAAIESHSQELVAGTFAVISPGQIRIRNNAP